mmetsp:Transcript_41350/g.127807  ORF Transcript_41350/g.127807 Transcript_41350/m.127807 type:complete len:405 (-) Transcript_41350:24-1238(-)
MNSIACGCAFSGNGAAATGVALLDARLHQRLLPRRRLLVGRRLEHEALVLLLLGVDVPVLVPEVGHVGVGQDHVLAVGLHLQVRQLDEAVARPAARRALQAVRHRRHRPQRRRRQRRRVRHRRRVRQRHVRHRHVRQLDVRQRRQLDLRHLEVGQRRARQHGVQVEVRAVRQARRLARVRPVPAPHRARVPVDDPVAELEPTLVLLRPVREHRVRVHVVELVEPVRLVEALARQLVQLEPEDDLVGQVPPALVARLQPRVRRLPVARARVEDELQRLAALLPLGHAHDPAVLVVRVLVHRQHDLVDRALLPQVDLALVPLALLQERPRLRVRDRVDAGARHPHLPRIRHVLRLDVDVGARLLLDRLLRRLQQRALHRARHRRRNAVGRRLNLVRHSVQQAGHVS